MNKYGRTPIAKTTFEGYQCFVCRLRPRKIWYIRKRGDPEFRYLCDGCKSVSPQDSIKIPVKGLGSILDDAI